MAPLHALSSLRLQGLPSPIRQLATPRRVPKHRPTKSAAYGPGVLSSLPRLPLPRVGTHQQTLGARFDGALVGSRPGISGLPLPEMRKEVFQVSLACAACPAGGNIVPILPITPMGIMGLTGTMGMQHFLEHPPIAFGGVSAVVPPQQRFPAARAAFRRRFGMLPQFHNLGG